MGKQRAVKHDIYITLLWEPEFQLFITYSTTGIQIPEA